jgi:CRP-like cAMP-binding protein
MELEIGIERFREYLRTNTPFDNPAFEAAISVMQLQCVRKNKLFVETGKLGRHFGFVVSGMMRGYFLEDGKDITTCLCGENSIASSSTSMIKKAPAEINVQALEDTYILTILFTDLDNLFANYSFWSNVGRLFAEKEFLNADCKVRCYGPKDAAEKYMLLLKDNPDIINRVPLQYIASLLGVRPETLSRIRKETAHRIS